MKVTIKKDKARKKPEDYLTPENLNCEARREILSLSGCTGKSCSECKEEVKQFLESGEIEEEINLGELVERESEIGIVLCIRKTGDYFYAVYNLRTSTFSNRTVSFKDIKESGWKKFKGAVTLTNREE